jgi:hypothetical protein
MVHNCILCNKNFPSKSQLDRHKNKKIPCNAVKESTDCSICNVTFPCLAKLKTHLESNKHKNNYNIYIQTYNDYSNSNIHIDNHINIINTFENTNISKIDYEFIENTYNTDIELINIFKEFKDDGCVSSNNSYFISCFKYFIKIFSKLNFNIAFNENHNCRCISFTLSDNNLIEYQILSYDTLLKEYTWDVIDYYIFIEKFLNLMHNIDDKFNNENFKNILNYIEKYKFRYISNKEGVETNSTARYCKKDIEKELLNEYHKFKKVKEDVNDEEAQIAKWREQNRIERKRDAKKLTMIRNAIENQMKNGHRDILEKHSPDAIIKL